MKKVIFKKQKLSRKADIKIKMRMNILRLSFAVQNFKENFKEKTNIKSFLKFTTLALPVLLVSFLTYDFYNKDGISKNNIALSTFDNKSIIDNKKELMSGKNNITTSEETKVIENGIEKDIKESKNSSQDILSNKDAKKEREVVKIARAANKKEKTSVSEGTSKKELQKETLPKSSSEKTASNNKKTSQSNEYAINKNKVSFTGDNLYNDSSYTNEAVTEEKVSVDRSPSVVEVKEEIKSKDSKVAFASSAGPSASSVASSHSAPEVSEDASEDNNALMDSSIPQAASPAPDAKINSDNRQDLMQNNNIKNLESISEKRVIGGYYNAISNELDKAEKLSTKLSVK